MKKTISLFLLAIAVMLATSGCSGSNKAKTTELTLWFGLNAEEASKPKSEWWVTQSIARFEAAHPGTKINHVVSVKGDQVISDLKAATLAGSGPDVADIFNGPVLISVKESLLPLNSYLTAEDKAGLVGWETVAEDMDPTKTIYGIPFGGQSVTGFAYNRSLIAKAGLNFDANPPRSLPEFYAALDKIKTAGILPIHTDESYPVLLLYVLSMWWVQQTESAGILAHNRLETKYVNDVGFINTLTEYQKFYQNGWINRDAATSSDTNTIFLQGGSAIHPIGNWDVDNFSTILGKDFGILPIPSYTAEGYSKKTSMGGVGAAEIVTSFTKNKDLAVALAKHLTSKSEQVSYCTVNFMIPARTDITPAEIGRADNPYFNEMASWIPSIYYWADNCMDSVYATLFYNEPVNVLVGRISPRDFAARLDAAMAE
ncbi:sugar ABC transporter substrate-binding protein [Spirochaetia bacterium]|nr:sugar ABC transporter substrate-binding protein [Spirochaetia bacterium]